MNQLAFVCGTTVVNTHALFLLGNFGLSSQKFLCHFRFTNLSSLGFQSKLGCSKLHSIVFILNPKIKLRAKGEYCNHRINKVEIAKGRFQDKTGRDGTGPGWERYF